VRKSQFLAALAGCILSMSLVGFYASRETAAQQPGRTARRPQHGGPAIALLDVSYVFKNHTRFKAMMADMKADVQRAEARVRSERDAIRKLAERLKDFRKGTPDYKALEEELVKRQADLAAGVQLEKKEFLQREAKIYYNVYQEVLQEVDYYAAANGIAMVLRFNGNPVDQEKPEDVLRHINKPVIWYAKNYDITPVVLGRINDRAFNPSSTAPHGPARRPGAGVPFH